jgi:ketosteroid isomerase-like protein
VTNEEVVDAMLAAFRAGDAGAGAAHLDRDVVLDASRLPDDLGGVHEGREAAGRFWSRWTFSPIRPQCTEIANRVFVWLVSHCVVATLRDGAVTRMVVYEDPEEALAAAGAGIARPAVGDRLAPVEDLEVGICFEYPGAIAPCDDGVLPAGTVIKVESVGVDYVAPDPLPPPPPELADEPGWEPYGSRPATRFWAFPEEYEAMEDVLVDPDRFRGYYFYNVSVDLADYAAGRLRPA